MENDGVCAVDLHPSGRRGWGVSRLHFLLDSMGCLCCGVGVGGKEEGGRAPRVE